MTGSASFSAEDRNRDGQHSIPGAQVHPEKNSRERTPSKTRAIPRDNKASDEKGKGEGGRACKDIPDCVPQAPLHHVLLVDCFSARLGVRVGFIIGFEEQSEGGEMRIYVTVMRNIFAVLSLPIYCILLCSRGLLVLTWSRIEERVFLWLSLTVFRRLRLN